MVTIGCAPPHTQAAYNDVTRLQWIDEVLACTKAAAVFADHFDWDSLSLVGHSRGGCDVLWCARVSGVRGFVVCDVLWCVYDVCAVYMMFMVGKHSPPTGCILSFCIALHSLYTPPLDTTLLPSQSPFPSQPPFPLRDSPHPPKYPLTPLTQVPSSQGCILPTTPTALMCAQPTSLIPLMLLYLLLTSVLHSTQVLMKAAIPA